MSDGFAYTNLFAKNLPAPAVRFAGYPKYNFIGGHNDPTLIPVEGLIEAATAALRKEGPKLAMYTAAQGSQGHLGLREFVKSKAKLRGIDCSTDDILITAGSGQGIDLINAVLLEPGDTVILEEFSYGGAINKLKREGQKIVGAPLDEDGIKIDALANILKDLKGKGVTPKYIYTIPTIQNPTGSIMPLERRRQLLAVEVPRHQLLVRLDDRVEQLLAVLGDDVGHVGRNLGRTALLRALGARVGVHVEQVDHAAQLVLRADRQRHGDARRGQLLLDLAERAVEVGPLAVEHVHDDHAGEAA